MLPIDIGRRTQVVKGEVCKTSMQRFESARRLQFPADRLRTRTVNLKTDLLLSSLNIYRPNKRSSSPLASSCRASS